MKAQIIGYKSSHPCAIKGRLACFNEVILKGPNRVIQRGYFCQIKRPERVRRCFANRIRFKSFSQLIKVNDILPRQLHDYSSAIGCLFDQAFGRKLGKGLADRRAADAEFLCERELRDGSTGSNLSRRDPLMKMQIGPFSCRTRVVFSRYAFSFHSVSAQVKYHPACFPLLWLHFRSLALFKCQAIIKSSYTGRAKLLPGSASGVRPG